VLLVFGAPCQLRLLAGQEHGRTIPLAEVMLISKSSWAWDPLLNQVRWQPSGVVLRYNRPSSSKNQRR
jgi:hypothetical protein